MTIQAKELRTADHAISDIFLNRWSPRAFADKQVSDDVLNRIFEAARWAPSSGNRQPWRFIVAKTPEDLKKWHPILMDGNLIWADKAPILVAVTSEKRAGSHAFDAGAAWGYLALQAAQEGLITHPMSGIHKDIAAEILNVPDEYEVQIIIAVGYLGEKEMLTEALQERETPSGRLPLSDILFESTFK